MAEIERKTKRYQTEPTDEEWVKLEPLPPGPAKLSPPFCRSRSPFENGAGFAIELGLEVLLRRLQHDLLDQVT